MSANKTGDDVQDPDYATAGPSNTIHQKFLEETARNNASQTIRSIIEREFSAEIDSKEKEIIETQERLQSALKTLHYLRYTIISDFYNRKQCVIQTLEDSRQTRIHPAIKQVLGKSPKPVQTFSYLQPSTSSGISPELRQDLGSVTALRVPPTLPEELLEPRECDQNPRKRERDEDTPPEPPKKIPRYVPPKSGIPEPQAPSRGVRYKVCRRVVVGNMSKWIPPEWREDRASHKWTMYVQGGKENPDIGEFVSKVRFFLDPSYRPNDVVEVRTAPFHLTRRGWGEFRLRIQIHFKNTVTKPVNIFHDLKLDRTYTGLQTLGSETVADIWLDTMNTPADQPTSPVAENPPEDTKSWDFSSHVFLEHDYAIMSDLTTKITCRGENNITISHFSPPRSYGGSEKSREIHGINGKNGFVTKTPNGYRENGVSPSLDLSLLASTFVSATEPLSINIPPTFQVNKQIFPVNSHQNNTQNNGISLAVPGKTDNCTNLMGKKNSAINIKVNPSKCLLLNSESSVPALKIADCAMENGDIDDNNDFKDIKSEKDVFNDSKKIFSDQLKAMGHVDLFEDTLKDIEDVKMIDIEALIRFLVKRLPIITEKALSSDYKKIHPYSCASEKEFLGFYVAKQRALEWYRARVIQTYLKSRNFEESQLWTTREIVAWCRLHGHTPVRLPMRLVGYQASKTTDKDLQEDETEDFINCHTESQALLELQHLQTHSMRFQECAAEEIIDIEGIDEPQCSRSNGMGVETMDLINSDLPKEVLPLHSLVCDTSRQIGVKIGPEEIVPGVSHCAAGRILVKALQCFTEDLLRTSFARAWEKNSNGSIPNLITPKDVLEAISSREEFDFLTNSGLGSLQYTDN